MTKENLDKQLTGQASATPFMTVKDGQSKSRSHSPHNNYNQRQVTFDRHGELDQKIENCLI